MQMFQVIDQGSNEDFSFDAESASSYLNDMRQRYGMLQRVGLSKAQRTPHCYETCIFDWDDFREVDINQKVFNFIAEQYVNHGVDPAKIGLRPQIIHYPAYYGCLGTHIHDNSVQKVGVISILYSSRTCGSFYIEQDKQVYFPNERPGETIIFDFGLKHGVVMETKNPDWFFESDRVNELALFEKVGRIVAVLTSEVM